MGTWDVSPFGNDTAGDFCEALDDAAEGSREGIVRDALTRVVEIKCCLDAAVAEEAVAAAALVAADCPGGPPSDPDYGPQHPLPDLTGLRSLAAQALERVTSAPSELMDLWAESEEGESWRATVGQIRKAL